MDILTAKIGANMAKSDLANSGQIGCVENPVITYDGNGEKIDLLGTTFAKISDNPVDLIGAKRATATMRNGYLLTGDVLVVRELGVTIAAIVSDNVSEIPVACSAPPDNEAGIAPGLYVFDGIIIGETSECPAYCSRIEFTETIHPIDQKYLPEKAIRLTDYDGLNTEVVNLILSGGGTKSVGLGRFWDDVFEKKPTEVIMEITGQSVAQRSVMLMYDKERCWQLGYSGMIYNNLGSVPVILDVKVLFHLDVSTSLTLIYVKVDTIPV